MTPAPSSGPATPPRRGVPLLAWIVLALGAAVLGAAVWIYLRVPTVDPVHVESLAVVAEFRQNLPVDYGNGLVLESVALQGRHLVMTVRSTRRTLASAARDPASFRRIRDEERRLMLPFCDNRDVRRLLDQGVDISRRYLDTTDQLFFEVTLTAETCRVRDLPPPPGPLPPVEE